MSAPSRAFLGRIGTVVLGTIIHILLVVIVCIGVPLGMGSNIWPIAAVFWCVLTVPVAAAFGALLGLILRRAPRALAIVMLLVSAAALSIVTGIVIAHNR